MTTDGTVRPAVATGHFTAENSATLVDLVKAPTVTSTEQYLRDLQAAGFVDLEVVDLSEPWTAWTQVQRARGPSC